MVGLTLYVTLEFSIVSTTTVLLIITIIEVLKIMDRYA
jgi:hypothetical protein